MRTFSTLIIMCGLVGAIIVEWGAASPPDSGPKPPASTEPRPTAERFDKLVREDMFAGFGGDEAALQRGLARCDATLKDDPRHAEALVWRGAVRVFQSSQLFGKNQVIAGLKLWNQGLKDMDLAVAIAPNAPGVRIPRAAVLLPAARSAPKAMSQPLLTRIRDDYESMARMQADHLDQLGTHPLGELRMGLADIYRLTGEEAKSKEQLELVRQQLPRTDYATRATEWLAAAPDAKLAHNCIGCHGQ